MLHARGIRTGRSFRRRHDSEEENVHFESPESVEGVLREVVSVVTKTEGVTKGKRLGYLNAAVRALSCLTSSSPNASTPHTNDDHNKALQGEAQTKVDLGEEDYDREIYFFLLRCCLIHEGNEVRAAGLRLLRYLLQTPRDVEALIAVNTIPLVVRCIDIALDNQTERVQGIRLARKILQTAPSLFPLSLGRCLVAIARDGNKERDRLLRSALATLNELAILNTSVFIESGGVSAVLHNILDCHLPRINEALLGTLLYLLNTPTWRPHCQAIHQIIAPFSDFHYKHTSYELEYYSRSEERELRTQAGRMAVLVTLRSWPGLIYLCQPNSAALRSMIALLYPNHEETRRTIVELLYEFFRIPLGEWTGDYEEALGNLMAVMTPDLDLWRLYEGFVAAEAKIVLPHIAKFRPNLIQNHLALVLYTLICVDLFPALCEVIITSSAQLSVRTTILLGELLHMANQNLPLECCTMTHTLPLLLERTTRSASDEDMHSKPVERTRATQAITALLAIARIRQKHECHHHQQQPVSLFLAGIIQCSQASKSKGKVIAASSAQAKISKWLGKEHDEVISHTLKDSEVLISGKRAEHWKWNLIMPVLRWPTEALKRADEGNYKHFVQILVHYYKPSSGLFANLELTHPQATVQAQAFLLLCDLLLQGHEAEANKFLEELLVDIYMALNEIMCERVPHDAVLSPSRLNTTTSQYYFLVIGRLSNSLRGHMVLNKAGIFELLLDLVSISVCDTYAKLVSTCLSYSITGLNRTILNKILTGCQESARLYATQLLRAFVRVEAENFSRWGIELLVGQLYDESRTVSLVALDVLDEACDHEEYLEAVLRNPPSVLHLGDRGVLLMAKLMSSPKGFRVYAEANFINPLLEKWATSFNLKYVRMMQTAIADSLTQHQRGEDGSYGRRTGIKHTVFDVFLLPHLYGALTLHKQGFSALMHHEGVTNCVQVVKTAAVGSPQEIYQLKAAIWALGHLGMSNDGIAFLDVEGILPILTHLAANCPVYSIRGTCFHALCLVATTREGCNLLKKYGWESVCRHHHEQLQFSDEGLEPHLETQELYRPRQNTDNNGDMQIQQHSRISESEGEERDPPKGLYYLGDDSDLEPSRDDVSDADFPLVEGIGLNDSYPTQRKAQTLPHKTKPPSAIGHQRSLSDCAPVQEELPQGTPSSGTGEDWSAFKRSSFRIKSKLMASLRRRSERRRESIGSRTSNVSSTSDRMASFLAPARWWSGKTRSRSLTEPTPAFEDDPWRCHISEEAMLSRQRQHHIGDGTSGPHHNAFSVESLASEEPLRGEGVGLELGMMEEMDEQNKGNEYQGSALGRAIGDPKPLHPIASGASIVTMGSMVMGGETKQGGRGGSIRGSSSGLFDAANYSGGGSSSSNAGVLSLQSYNKLRSITGHRRIVSESSQDEQNSRNSLRGFISHSIENAEPNFVRGLLEGRGIARSPSGCSEVSSVHSISGGSLVRNAASFPTTATVAPYRGHHSSGQCYLGLALPFDLDLLLYDAEADNRCQQDGKEEELMGAAWFNFRMKSEGVEIDAGNEGRNRKDEITVIHETEHEGDGGSVEEDHEKNTVVEDKSKFAGLELHTKDQCLACFTLQTDTIFGMEEETVPGDGEVNGQKIEGMLESPPLQRLKATSDTSETSEPSSVNSAGWEDQEEHKTSSNKENRISLRKEILRFITNLSSSIVAKSSELGLLTLKQRWPKAFQDTCLYGEICCILEAYSYRLAARRFIQELFMEITFAEVYEKAEVVLNRLLKQQAVEAVNPLLLPTSPTTVPLPVMADIAETALSDQEEDC